MESPSTYILKEFGTKGDIKNSWGYHICEERYKKEFYEFGFNSFEASYAIHLDGHFVIMKRRETFFGRQDFPIGVRTLNQVEEIDKILYVEIRNVVEGFEGRFENFRRKVKDLTTYGTQQF